MSDINEMNAGPRWYVAHTYSGYENKVKMNLEKIVENRGLGHLIFDVRVPVETIVESDGGVEREIESKIFPSYVLVKMVMTDESWHVVRNIRGVTGFVGPGSRPVPLTDEEAAAIIALKTSIPSIIVSGAVLFAATIGVAAYSQADMISSMCMLMARGAIISIFVVPTFLPSLLILADPLIIRTTLGMKKLVKRSK